MIASMFIARQVTLDPRWEGQAPLPSDGAEPAVAGESWLVCQRCEGFVAEGRARIRVNGSHAHAFINPAGAIFRVGCFAEAPGMSPFGEASGHWTWFSGFDWQVGICRACNAHLGWSYRNAARHFVALILDQVVERSGTEGSAFARKT
jgi:hypothetical protein